MDNNNGLYSEPQRCSRACALYDGHGRALACVFRDMYTETAEMIVGVIVGLICYASLIHLLLSR